MKANNLKEYRQKLDEIDKQIQNLLEERFKITTQIGKEKYELNLTIENKDREKEIINNINDSFYQKEIKEIYHDLFIKSKEKQKFEYFLIGKNISYSISPMIHQMLGLNNFNIYDGDLDTALQGNYKGVNITIPYKKNALLKADILSNEVIQTKVCNTLVKKDNKIYAYNNDYYAFLKIFENFKLDLKNKKILIIGNGATTDSAYWALMRKEPLIIKRIVRNKKREDEVLLEDYPKFYDYHFIINTTPYGTSPNYQSKPLFPLDKFKCLKAVLDVVYNPIDTPLIKEARKNNIKAINGLYMMVSQAALTEEVFGFKKVVEKTNDVYQRAGKYLQNIVLIGMPHSGKTTIGQKLANMMDKQFIDIDDKLLNKGISLTNNPTVNDLLYFRKNEENETCFHAHTFNKVISTGGGIVLNEKAMNDLKDNGIVIFLNVNIKELEKRVDGTRPLAPTIEAINKIYEERRLLYLKYADIILEENFDIELIKEKIYEYLNNKWS